MTDETKPKTADWERIEADYRAGVMSLREIASSHGITEGAIRKRAKRDNWVRDLAAKVRARADDLVRKQAVRSEVRNDPVAERVLIEANAQVIAEVRSRHRRDIGMARDLCMTLIDELKQQTGNLGLLSELGVMLRSENDQGVDRLNDVYHAVISLPERTKTMKALAESLKHLIGLEREAYSIAPEPVQHELTGKDGLPLMPSSLPVDPAEASRIYREFMQQS